MKKYFIAFLLFFSFQVQAILLFECNMSREGAIATVRRWIAAAERDQSFPSFIVRKHEDQKQEFIFPEMLSPRVVSAARTGEGHYVVVVGGAMKQVTIGVHRCGGIY